MKKLLITLAVSIFFLTSPIYAQIKWEKGPIKDTLVKSKVLQRKIFIDFYATWCSTCIKLDQEVFQKGISEKLSKEFLCLKYDAEQGEGRELAKKFNIISYPTLLILDKDGNEIDRVLDYEEPSSFMKIVFDYALGKGVIKSLEERLKNEPQNLQLLFDTGEKFAFRGDEPKANQYLGKITELDPKNTNGLSVKALFTLGKYLYLRGQNNYSKALSIFNEIDNQFPDSPYAKETDLERAKAYVGMEKDKEALSSLNSFLLKNKLDLSARAQNAFAWFCYRNNFRMDEGLKVAKEGIELNPKSDSLYDTMAQLYGSLGENDKAVNAIRKAMEIKPSDSYYKTQLDKFIKKRDESKKKK